MPKKKRISVTRPANRPRLARFRWMRQLSDRHLASQVRPPSRLTQQESLLLLAGTSILLPQLLHVLLA